MKYLCDGCSRLVDFTSFTIDAGELRVACPACGATSKVAGVPLTPAAPDPKPASPADSPVAAPAPLGGLGLPPDLEQQWTALLGKWSDSAAHTGFIELAALQGQLPELGRRYRQRADAGDPVAAAARDQVVRRAIAFAHSTISEQKSAERKAGVTLIFVVLGTVALLTLAVILLRTLA